MILILSQSQYEYTTALIIDWLYNKNANFIRINGDDLHGGSRLKVWINKDEFIINDWDFKKLEIKVVFNRRWLDLDQFLEQLKLKDLSIEDGYKLITSLRNEFTMLSDYFFENFKNAIWIPYKSNVNKLKVLRIAQEVDLDTPNTWILSRKSNIKELIEGNHIITKSIADLYPFGNSNKVTSFLTKEVSKKEIEFEEEMIFPSLFQEKIDKEFEIRTFYFFGQCLSISIFSQKDATTAIDFRNYNLEKPNRKEPYKLPNAIEVKVDELMKRLNLNTGSIDFIKTKDHRFILLEVNPVGQFGMIEDSGNYNIHEMIAANLIEIDNGK